MVRHGKEGFLAQAEALSLHGCGDHLKCLARAHLMGKERIAAVEVVGEGVSLASGLSPVPHAHSESTITQAKSRAMSFFICFPLFHRFLQKIKPPPKQPLRRGISPAAKACFGKRLVHRFLNYVSLLDILPYMHIHCNTKLAPPICSAALLRSFHKVL